MKWWKKDKDLLTEWLEGRGDVLTGGGLFCFLLTAVYILYYIYILFVNTKKIKLKKPPKPHHATTTKKKVTSYFLGKLWNCWEMPIAEFRIFERLLSFHLPIYTYSIYSSQGWTSIKQTYTYLPFCSIQGAHIWVVFFFLLLLLLLGFFCCWFLF